MGCFDHQSARRLAAISGRVSWSTGCERFARQRAHPTSVEGVLFVTWNLPQQKSTKKKKENRVCCRFFMCLGGSRLNLRKYDPSPTKFEELTLAEVWGFPPHRKKTLKKAPLRVKILYIFWNHMNHIYIYIQSSFSWLISRFWRVYHPHWKKVKGFFKNPMKDLWHLGWILGRPAVDHRVIFRLHHHENLIS